MQLRLFNGLRHWRAAAVLLFCALLLPARAAVVINELMAAPSERQLSWSSNGVPRLGSGVAWMEPDFAANGWPSGNLPAGYGFGGLATDLSFAMSDKAPSLYLRKEFNVTPEEAALADALSLLTDYNDGFVAYVNGREVFRANCGGTNRFMFASQPAFNVNTNNGLAQFDLGPVNALLVPGRNVLAIQAHNAEQPSTPSQPGLIIQHLPTPEFKINAGLRTAGAVVQLRASSFNFDDAAGGAKTHANTNGVMTDTTTGMLAPNGWLARSANPTSASTWQGLRIVAAELPGVGLFGSGALRYTINQSGPSQSAEVRAPVVSMTGGWTVGVVGAANLAGTRVRFRYQTTGDAQFGLRFEPALGLETNALSGFPIVSSASQPPITFSNATNGARVMTIDTNGIQTQSRTGTLRSAMLFAMASSDVRSMTFRIIEDATDGAGYSSTGHLRAEITQAASAGTSWGFSYGAGLTVSNWTAGNISTQDLAYATFQFACKIPAGVTFQVWAEPASGGFTDRVDWGTLTGDGTWQVLQRDFASAPGAENFRTALNATNSRSFKLVFQASALLGVGTWIQLDDFQILPWRKYEVRLGDATNGQPAFLSFLNANNLVSFIPTFEKLTAAPPGGQTLTIDDYELVYFGTNNVDGTTFLPPGPAGGPWKYFVGRAEPSGGVFDPGLLTNNFVPPAGEEDDFEQPANFVDWVELFNDGAAPVDLSNWSLTDERDTPAKWRFPTNTILPLGGYLLVLCDDREEANAPAGPATYLHASFNLSSDGEYLALFDNNGVFVDGLTSGYPRQVFFCSYGRNPTNPTQFGFLATATPGTDNLGPFYPARVDAPEFKRADGANDLPGGLYFGPSLTLLLTNDTRDSIIRYTLNGSEPTEWNGALYTAPL
ncbi:MAG TPA: lamin tail domain-containing protein, partial [Verrucomicrobiae bacterium]